mgnify:CR=1 FL=1|jgi:hypothetical protein
MSWWEEKPAIAALRETGAALSGPAALHIILIPSLETLGYESD